MGLLIATPLMEMTPLEMKLELMGALIDRGDWTSARSVSAEIVRLYDREDR